MKYSDLYNCWHEEISVPTPYELDESDIGLPSYTIRKIESYAREFARAKEDAHKIFHFQRFGDGTAFLDKKITITCEITDDNVLAFIFEYTNGYNISFEELIDENYEDSEELDYGNIEVKFYLGSNKPENEIEFEGLDIETNIDEENYAYGDQDVSELVGATHIGFKSVKFKSGISFKAWIEKNVKS